MLASSLRAFMMAALAATAFTAQPAAAYEQLDDRLLSGNYLAGRSAA